MKNSKYRNIFVVEPSHDFSGLKDHCNHIVFLTTGYEEAQELVPTITMVLATQFDPTKDAILPVGRVVACVATGIALGQLTKQPITIGTYSRENGYRFFTQEEV